MWEEHVLTHGAVTKNAMISRSSDGAMPDQNYHKSFRYVSDNTNEVADRVTVRRTTKCNMLYDAFPRMHLRTSKQQEIILKDSLNDR